MKLKLLTTIAASLALTAAVSVSAQDTGSYKAGIWIDPDGCQHWVLDLGVEGMMDPVLSPDGTPQCSSSCANISSDALFNVDSADLRGDASSQVAAAAAQIKSLGSNVGITVVGHTDSTASDAYNKNLSVRRAQAVANALQQNGVRITGVQGMGEAQPRSTNDTAQGRQANRRVELLCR